jgi:hypothetical protein
MTRLDAAGFRRLAADARDPALLEAKSYLAEALENLRLGDDPVNTLELLRALWGTGYASGPAQKAALEAVGSWLEQRLRRERGVSVERLRSELGWLRRMVMAQRAWNKDRPDTRARGMFDGARQRSGPPASVKPTGPKFGHKLDELRSARTRALKNMSAPPPAASPSAVPRGVTVPRPSELPEVFAVAFADIRDVRQARRKAKERRDNHKKPKDRLIALRAVEAALAPLTANLACSLAETPGLEAVFAAMDAQGGISPRFYVCRTDLAERDGKRVALRISLTAPEV